MSPLFPAATDPLAAWLTPAGGTLSRKQRPAESIEDGTLTSLPQQRRAMDLFKAGRFAAAAAAFDGLAAADPERVDWLFMKGISLLELGDCRAGLATLSEAERLAPWDPDVLLIKADAHIELREYDRAEEAFRRLLAADPDNSRGRYRFAWLAARTGYLGQALSELRCVIAADSSFREEAAADPVFAGLRSLPAFRKLLAAPPQPE